MIHRHHVPHALLLALVRKPMAPEQLREHGKLFAAAHAVNVAFQRLRERQLIEVEVRITDRGRRFLRRSGE